MLINKYTLFYHFFKILSTIIMPIEIFLSLFPVLTSFYSFYIIKTDSIPVIAGAKGNYKTTVLLFYYICFHDPND